MARIIAIVNQKGGVGKTTTAMNLAAALAQRGKFVLLADLDPQANASSGLGVAYRDIAGGMYQALGSPEHTGGFICKTALPTLSVLPATPDLAGAAIELVSLPEREFLLKKALLPVRNNFDYIIIDCPPSLGLLTINGLVAAEDLLVPVQAEYYALEGIGHLLETVRMVQAGLHPQLRVLGAVITMFDLRNQLSKSVLEEMYRYFPNKIFRTVIPRNVKLAEAPSHGKDIFSYDPSSKGARAYGKLAEEVIGQLQ